MVSSARRAARGGGVRVVAPALALFTALGLGACAAPLPPRPSWVPPRTPADESPDSSQGKSQDLSQDSSQGTAPVAGPVLLTPESLPAWRAYIVPGADDLAYASIPWHVTFGEGMNAARAEGKPLLMWAMNGHPLGCT